MTAGCPANGPSQPKPGAPAVAAASFAAITVALTAGGVPWLIPYVAMAGVEPLNTGTFCAGDPPAAPAPFTQNEQIALVTPFGAGGAFLPADYYSANQKVDTIVRRAMWYALCQCVDPPTPPVPVPIASRPANIPDYLPAGSGYCVKMEPTQVRVLNLWNGTTNNQPPTGWQSPTFDDSAWPFAVAANMTGALNLTVLNPVGSAPVCPDHISCALFPFVAHSALPANTAQQLLFRWRFQLPAGINGAEACITAQSSTPSGGGSAGWVSGSGNINGVGNFLFFNTGSWNVHGRDLRAGDNLLAFSANDFGVATWGDRCGVQIYIQRAGAIGAPANGGGCCPPDPWTTRILQSILDGVVLSQRHETPFAYILGAQHSGLTGTAQLTLPNGLLGLRVDLPTIPPSYGVEFGTPDLHEKLAFVSVGTPDGWIRRKEVAHQPFLWFPEEMPWCTRLGYTFSPGVVGNITEVQAEP